MQETPAGIPKPRLGIQVVSHDNVVINMEAVTCGRRQRQEKLISRTFCSVSWQ